jgi:hypothetical protein
MRLKALVVSLIPLKYYLYKEKISNICYSNKEFTFLIENSVNLNLLNIILKRVILILKN